MKHEYNYRIRLRPLDYYFFGGEQTFGFGSQQNYYAKSRAWPQQTAVLGLLRHLGHKNHHGKEGIDIGESFKAGCSQLDEAKKPFGYIRRISPLFFTCVQSGEKMDHYIPGPLLGTEEGKPFNVEAAESTVKSWKNKAWEKTFYLKDYSAKAERAQWLISSTAKPKKISDVVVFFDKVGLDKPKNGPVPSDGFYKHRVAKLESDWCFSVLANLDEQQAAQLPSSSILPFGAEKALFHVQLEKIEVSSFEYFFPESLWEHTFPESVGCVSLLCDALVEEEIYEKCCFAITEIETFRNISTPLNAKNFASLALRQNGQIPAYQRYKSKKYVMLRRGSLLYGNTAEIKEMLNKRSYYQLIGYNHYVIVSGKNQ